jgi:hypothetical protein
MPLTSHAARLARTLLLLPLASACVVGASAVAGDAQERMPPEAVRAINLARTYAVRLNGGLQVYRPAACMFATAARSNPCLERTDDEGFLFRFLGGPPAWEERNQPATRETEILIAPDGRRVEQLLYNGDPR